MKKISFYFLALFSLFIVVSSCEKKDHEERTETPQSPQTVIPDAFVGKWMLGYFDMALFWNFDGTSPDDATNMVAYTIKKDGSAEQYIYYKYDDGSNKQIMNYRKGTATFNATTKTLRFCPTEGQYRIFENGEKTEDAISSNGLYPAYAPQYRDCTFDEENEVLYLVATNDQNERIGFAKRSW